jgi:hypothetical protein
MLDTIAITLKQSAFEVTDMDAFSPSARGLYQPPYSSMGKRGFINCVHNPLKSELAQGIYKPRLTLTKRKMRHGYDYSLRIEFSAPKLKYGNNFDELTDADFLFLINKLHPMLREMGIKTTVEHLRKATVSAVHYSKNMRLADFTTCSMVIGELGKIDLTTRLDSNKTDYRNTGSAIRAHANSYEIVFYDKVQDMRQGLGKSEKRGFETDYGLQRDFFEALPRGCEVLRMEVRLGNRTKLKSLLQTLGIKSDMTFENLFSSDISRIVLLHYWDKMTHDLPLLALSQFQPEELYQALQSDSEMQAKPAKMLQRLGMFALVRSVGLRGAKSLITQNADSRTWQRIKKDMNGLDSLANMKFRASQQITACLHSFEPITLTEEDKKKVMP